MADLPDLYDATLSELQAGLQTGLFSSVQLVEAYLARIEEVNTKGPQPLRAVLQVSPVALAAAAQCDEERASGRSLGPLHGIPILVKDVINTRKEDGMDTTAGSYALVGAKPKRDAFVVQKLREAGAIILGKTNLSQWNNCRSMGRLPSGWSSVGGQSLSPFYPNGNPLGSSSGSAVAASIGLCGAALGAETNGSIVAPAMWASTVGMRPTVGLISRYGVAPISSNYDSVGPITRTVADAAVLLRAIAGPDPADQATLAQPSPIPDYVHAMKQPLVGMRIGVPRPFFTEYDTAHNGLDPSVGPVFEEALDLLREAGAVIVDVEIKNLEQLFNRDDFHGISAIDFKADLAAYLAEFDENSNGIHTLKDLVDFNDAHPELEKPLTYAAHDWLEANATAVDRNDNAEYAAKLMNDLQAAQDAIETCIQDHNVSVIAFPGFNSTIWAKARYPQIVVPMGFLPNSIEPRPVTSSAGGEFAVRTFWYFPGLPYGITFGGSAYSEAQLLQAAYAYEQRSQARSKRRAMPEATPKTQLADVQIADVQIADVPK